MRAINTATVKTYAGNFVAFKTLEDLYVITSLIKELESKVTELENKVAELEKPVDATESLKRLLVERTEKLKRVPIHKLLRNERNQ